MTDDADPDEPSLARLLEDGLAHHRAGQLDAAAALYRRILEREPDHVDANQLTGLIAKRRGHLAEAVERMTKALARRPDDAEITYNLGNTHWFRGDLESAIACYDRALALKPQHENAWVNRGRSLQHLGREHDAAESFRRATEVRPSSGKAWENLMLARQRVAPDDPDLAAMRSGLDALDPTGPDARSLHFALARASASHGDRTSAFAHYAAGNAIAWSGADYDVGDDERLFARIREAFPADRLAPPPPGGDPDPRPIFIVGMPRSGTTLVEQILASHSDVRAGGERHDLPAVIQQVRVEGWPEAAFPAWVPLLEPSDETRIGRAYLDRLPAADGRRHITDKMPANFRLVGLIRRILPGARIVHVQREPADTCLSCFFQNFTNGNLFAFDQTALGRYYRAYDALMAHWRAAMPDQAWLELRYEDLIADPEAHVDRLLTFCGLSWEPACLAFHETDRPVMTASMSQVRQPLYQSAVGRWRRYKPFLGPLFRALGGLAPGDGG